MLITIRHRGGYAGLDKEIARVDTIRLSSDAAKKIEAAVEQLDLKKLSGSASGQAVGADFLAYEITLDRGGAHNTVRVADDGGEVARKIREFAEVLRPYSTAA